MEAYLYKEKNANGVPQSYIISLDGDKPDPIPTENQDFLETQLNGDQLHYNNKDVYQTLLAWINDGSATTYAINHKTTLDVRSLWLDLVNAYKGEDVKQLAISVARNTIATTYFTHESMSCTFTDYCNEHMAANNELLLRGVPMDGVSQVIQSIKVPELMAVKSNVIMNHTTRDDLQKATILFKDIA